MPTSLQRPLFCPQHGRCREVELKIKVKSLPWPMDLLSMPGPRWEFPGNFHKRGGSAKKWNVPIILLRFWCILGVSICETHERRKTINTKKPVRSRHTRAKEYHL